MKIERIESTHLLEKCALLLMEVYNAEPWNDKWNEEKAFEKLLCYFNSPKIFGLIAVEEKNILGCSLGNIEPYYTGDYFYLKEMFVSVKSQRKGFGSQMMASLKEHLEIIGIKSIILFTSKALFPYDFYQKNNFKLMEDMCMMNFE